MDIAVQRCSDEVKQRQYNKYLPFFCLLPTFLLEKRKVR